MARYRKKPVIVEARRFKATYECALDITTWINEATGFDPAKGGDPEVMYYYGDLTIRTLEGDMHARDGDWIIKGVAGEFYPCKPDTFEATYEPVEGGEAQHDHDPA